MDDLAHDFPLNHRKRKADTTDQDPADDLTVPTPEAPPAPSAAPRQPWLASGSEWTPTSPQVLSPLSSPTLFNPLPSNPTKRPRLKKIETFSRPAKKPILKKSPVKVTWSRPPPTARHGSDIEDLGIVPMSDPGPSTGSLLHLRTGPRFTIPLSPPVTPSSPIDFNSSHIPPRHPLINRQTLKELELDAILRNPQLRHDLLFDPGLQFRPTCSRKKCAMSEKYWAAILQELETGCTCVSFDLHGKPHPVVCVCAQIPKLPSQPVVTFSSAFNVFTLRTPSRICSLLTEFLEVLLLVIQPLSNVSGMYVNPDTFTSQMHEHSAQAAYIRSVFDPALIDQELKHELFDPSGLFCAIGDTLKGHCAPMRDRAVEMIVQTALSCAPGGPGTKHDAVAAVRMCMELLELMKLDIANHQLQTLRPFLIHTSGHFELKAFKSHRGGKSLQTTREWLRLAHTDMLARGPIIVHDRLQYSALPRNKQTYLAVLRGLVDLVFEPPPPAPPSSLPSTSSSIVRIVTSTPSRLTGYPETSYLDNVRLTLLGADAADIIAMHMFLLLYRQLVYSEFGDSPFSSRNLAKVEDTDLLKLKTEIRDIGSARLACFMSYKSFNSKVNPSEKEVEVAKSKQDIVLQVAKWAKEAHSRYRSSLPTSQPSSISGVPDEQIVSLAQRWTDSNIRPDSPLAIMLRHRLRDAIFNSVIAMAYPRLGNPSNIADYFSFPQKDSTVPLSFDKETGMKPLTEEIRTLAEKISRIALIHLNAFLPLYEQDGFLE